MIQGDREHLAFEEYGKEAGLDMSMHPMFLLYLNKDTDKALQSFKAGFKSKSIVKKVDPDNLPEGEVLAFDGALSCVGEIVSFRGVVCECSDGESYLNNVTHYIDYKDLIKLFTGDV